MIGKSGNIENSGSTMVAIGSMLSSALDVASRISGVKAGVVVSSFPVLGSGVVVVDSTVSSGIDVGNITLVKDGSGDVA